jgi:large subunit ribosomal protein L24
MASKLKLKLKKGDDVIVIAGRDKGKSGKVMRTFPNTRRLIVQGVNTVRRHTRPTRTQSGGIVEKELPISIANVAIQDPKTGQASRIGYKFLEDGRKVRVAKASGEVIDA